MHQQLNEGTSSMDTTEYNNKNLDSQEIKRQKTTDSNNASESSLNQEIQVFNQQNNVIHNSFTVIQLKFVNEEDSFDTISLFDVKDFLNNISTSWELIDYSNDLKSMTFTEKEDQCTNILINVKEIKIKEKSFDVEITKVTNLNKNKGIVYMKHIRLLSNEEIINRLKDQNVSDIVRITKTNENGNVYDTGSFIIIFNGEVPENIYFENFLSIPVNKLKPKPMKCTHCQLIGHTIKRCLKINQEMCKNCFQEIVSNIEDHTCILKCKNCNLDHKSDDKNCPDYKKEIEILEIKSKFGFSYSQAKQKLIQQQKEENQHQKNTRTELQLIQDKYDSIVEKHRKSQVTLRKEIKERKHVEQFVIPEFKKTIEILESKVEKLQNHIEKINIENKLNCENLTSNHLRIVEQIIQDSEKSAQIIREESNRANEDHQNSIDKFNTYKESMEKYKESMDTGMEFIRELFDTEPAARSIYNSFCEKKEKAGNSILKFY